MGPYCVAADTLPVLLKGLQTGACPYHRLVHLDPSRTWQVTSACVPVNEMVHESRFVLPPVMEWFYKKSHPFYRSLPPFHPSCPGSNPAAVMEMIYPRENDQVFIPVQLTGKAGQVILEAAHTTPDAVIYWHLDGEYLGETTGMHQMGIRPLPGKHFVTLVDNLGNRFVKSITVVQRE